MSHDVWAVFAVTVPAIAFTLHVTASNTLALINWARGRNYSLSEFRHSPNGRHLA